MITERKTFQTRLFEKFSVFFLYYTDYQPINII